MYHVSHIKHHISDIIYNMIYTHNTYILLLFCLQLCTYWYNMCTKHQLPTAQSYKLFESSLHKSRNLMSSISITLVPYFHGLLTLLSIIFL